MHKQTMNSLRLGCIAAALMMVGSAHAQSADTKLSSQAYNGARTELRTTYKTERDACNSQSANAKDICVQTAKGRENVAMAHLQYQRSGSTKDGRDLAQARYKARYDVAKEMCDDQTGDAKKTCLTTATTERDKAKGDIKMNKQVAEARDEARETRMKADYQAANARCDTLKGVAKDGCVASARARFNQ